MNIAVILTTFLTHFLPHLLKLGQPIAEEGGRKLGEKLGEGTWEKAKELWTKISPKVKAKPIALGAATELAENPEDEEAKGILISQLNRLLKEDQLFARDVTCLLQGVSENLVQIANITQSSTGNENVLIGQSYGNVTVHQAKDVEES